MSSRDDWPESLIPQIMATANLAPHLHLNLGAPENAGTWVRFRLKVRRERVTYRPSGTLYWLFEVHDVCRPPGMTMVRSGARFRWDAAVRDGLRDRNEVEQEWAWSS